MYRELALAKGDQGVEDAKGGRVESLRVVESEKEALERGEQDSPIWSNTCSTFQMRTMLHNQNTQERKKTPEGHKGWIKGPHMPLQNMSNDMGGEWPR